MTRIHMILISATICLWSIAGVGALEVQPARQTVHLKGYTRSKNVMAVSSEVRGRVTAVNYETGDTAGSRPFIEVDPTFIDLRIAGMRRSLEQMEIAMERNRSRTAYLEKEFQRIDILHQGDRATEVRRDAALEELNQAKLEGRSLAAEKASLEITLTELREEKKRHSIHVPSGWIITERMVEAGEVIAPGISLGRAADFHSLVVPLAVSPDELDGLKTLPERFDAVLENEPAKASIRWINPEFDESTRKIAIELILHDISEPKRGGLRFSVPVDVRVEGLWVPKDAVVSRYENPRVTIKATGEVVNLMVIGETGGYLIVADSGKLEPGMELSPP